MRYSIGLHTAPSQQLHYLVLLLVLGCLLPSYVRGWSFAPRVRTINRGSRRIQSAGRTCHMIRMMAKDGEFVRVSLPKPLGIQLEEVTPGSPGVRVAGVVEGGTAKDNGEIGANMLLVELSGKDVTGATFDSVMEALVSAPAGTPIDLVFRDPAVSAAESPAEETPPAAPATPEVAMGTPCEVTVKVGGKEAAKIKAKTGDNLRKTLLANKIEVYDMVGKMTNCNGGGQCGTCAVQVEEAKDWDERSDWEANKLKGRPASQRLSCQTIIKGDAIITTKPPKKG